MAVYTFKVAKADYRSKYDTALNTALLEMGNAGLSGWMDDDFAYINLETPKAVLIDIANAINATQAEKDEIGTL